MINEISSNEINPIAHIKNEIWKIWDLKNELYPGVGSEEYNIILYFLLLHKEGVVSPIIKNNPSELRDQINNINERFEDDKEVFFGLLQNEFLSIINRMSNSGIERIFQLLESLDQEVLKQNFSEIFDDFLFKYLKSNSRYNTEYVLPQELTKFICSLVDLPEKAMVYNPFAGLASFIVGFNKDYYGASQEINRTTHTIGLMRLIAYDRFLNNVYIQDDSINNWNFEKEKYDLIVSSPPFGMRLQDNIIGKFGVIKTAESFLVERGIDDLKNDGKLIAVVSKGFLSDPGTAALRKHIVLNDLLDMVISFPPGVLSYTNIPFVVIMLNKSKKIFNVVRFVDAVNFIENKSNREKRIKYNELSSCINRNEDSESFRFVNIAEISETDFKLDVNRYFLKVGDEINVRTITLGEIAKVRAKENPIQPGTTGRFIRIRDLKKEIVRSFLKVEEVEITEIPKYANEIKYASILLALKFKRLKPTIIGGIKEPTYISNDIMALKVDENIMDFNYLISELNSEYVQRQVDAYSTGNTITSISRKDVLGIKIRILNKEEQSKEFNRRMDLFYRTEHQKLEEFKRQYNPQTEALKEVVTLKHSLGRPLLNIGSGVRIIEKWLLELSDSDDKKELENTFESLKQNLQLANNLLERNENEFIPEKYILKETELISFLDKYLQGHKNYNFNTGTFFPFDIENELSNSIFILANEDLLTVLFNNVLDNADRHAFKPEYNEENTVIFAFQLLLDEGPPSVILSIKNNGLAFAENFGKEKFIRKNVMAGETGNTGIGGYDIFRIANYLNWSFDLRLNEAPDFPVSYEFTFPIQFNKDIDDQDL